MIDEKDEEEEEEGATVATGETMPGEKCSQCDEWGGLFGNVYRQGADSPGGLAIEAVLQQEMLKYESGSPPAADSS